MAKPLPNRIVAIDYGQKRMGLAISDENQTMALPWTTVLGGASSVIEKLLTRKKEIQTILIGLPLHMDGSRGQMAALVELFAKEIEKALQVPVILIDERLSSKHAETVLRDLNQSRKKTSEKTDQIAASLLLESYLFKQG